MNTPRRSGTHASPIVANRTTAAAGRFVGGGAVQRVQSLMGNWGAQQFRGRTYVTTQEQKDATPERTAAHLPELGNPKYGPYLAFVNGIDGLAWRPGLRLFVPNLETIDPTVAERILVDTYAREKRIIDGRRQPTVLTLDLSRSDAPDPAEVAANRRERDKAAALDWMLMVDGIEAKVEAAVGKELLVPRGYGYDGLRLSHGAAKFLRKLLGQGFNADIDFEDVVDFKFAPSSTFRIDPAGRTAARTDAMKPLVYPWRWVVTIDEAVWNDPSLLPTSAHRLGLLAHELTHVVQYGKPVTDAQTKPIYAVPIELKRMPFKNLDPVDSRFTTEQIASRAMSEVLMIFHAEPETWSEWTSPQPRGP